MLELKLVREKLQDGKNYLDYEIGKYQVNVVSSENGWKQISIRADYNERYLPDIYYHYDICDSFEPRFQIQTTSYGALNSDEIENVIKGYEIALEVVEALTKEFI